MNDAGEPTGSQSSSPPTARLDTSNKQTVRPITDGFIGYRPTSSLLSEDDAINLAAWLVAMVPGGRRRFDAMLSEIDKG